MEHDPLLYEDAEKRMVEDLTQALRQTSREATILLYALTLDTTYRKPNLSWLTLVFCI